MKSIFYLLLSILAFAASGAEAKLNIEPRPEGYVIFVTGGTSNVQYQVWTSPQPYTVDATNWYFWRRIYSRDFISKPEQAEVLVHGTNTTFRLRSFYQIRGILPD